MGSDITDSRYEDDTWCVHRRSRQDMLGCPRVGIRASLWGIERFLKDMLCTKKAFK